MFDLFGIKARKEAKRQSIENERLAKVQEEKKRYQERKRMIDEFLDKYNRDRCSQEAKEYNKRDEWSRKLNSICPKCGSTHIINTISRTKGEIKGQGKSSSSSSFSSGLFTSSSSTNSSSHFNIDGELDTYPINKCSECGHEWNISNPEYPTIENIYEDYDSYLPAYLRHRIEEYLDMEYDPYDYTENYDSLEDKRNALCEKVSNVLNMKPYQTTPRYMLEYALFTTFNYYDMYEYNTLGCTKEMNKYSYQMPDEIWEVVKKLLKWQGEEPQNESEIKNN